MEPHIAIKQHQISYRSIVNAQLSKLAVAIQIKYFLSACFAEY